MVTTSEDTWIECLGDLGSYRIAIEDSDKTSTDTWIECLGDLGSYRITIKDSDNISKDTWIECPGDLGSYRMAIEDSDEKDCKVRTCVARFCYSKAAHRDLWPDASVTIWPSLHVHKIFSI